MIIANGSRPPDVFPVGSSNGKGGPTTREILTSRLIDRPIRPLFPEWFHDEVQVQAFTLAADRQNDPDVLAMIAASAALSVSSMPFQGPIGSVRMGYVDGQFIPFPTQEQLEASDLDLILSGSAESVLMIEGFAREMSEELMAQAIAAGHDVVRQIVQLQKELIEKVQPVKAQYDVPPPDALFDRLRQKYFDALLVVKQTPGKKARADAWSRPSRKRPWAR